MSEAVISIQGLVKRYGAFTAVNGLNMEVARGEVFGLLGPNGAGKTTTLECLEGLRRADGGTLRVAGCSPQEDPRGLRRRLGVQLQSSALPDSILAGEAVSLISAWHGRRGKSDLIRRFGVGDFLGKQYRELSTGQKRRLNLVLAMVNDPEVIILDEPTAGLDVQSRAQLHDEIRSIRGQGVTVLLATHDMAEAEELCDRIAILIRGRLAVCGTPEQVTAAGSRRTSIRLRTARGSLLPGGDIDGGAFVRERQGYLEWSSGNIEASVSDLLKKIRQAGDAVEDLRVERPSLEERFLELVEGAENR